MNWFLDWVDVYCTATGADQRAAEALRANASVVVEHWRATIEELGEVATRLVASGRTPKFANEHLDALGRELVALRKERATAERPTPGDFDSECAACGGSGFAVVPVRACVWQGRLVLHKMHKRVVTCAVLCDRTGCTAGERARDCEHRRRDDKPRRPTLSQCEHAAGVDLAGMTRLFEREVAKRARDGGSESERFAAFAGAYPRIAAAVKGVASCGI